MVEYSPLASLSLFLGVSLRIPKEQDSAKFAAGLFLSPERPFQVSRRPGQGLRA